MGTSPPVRGLSPNRMEMVTPAPGKPTGEVGGSADSTCCWTSMVQRRVSTRTFSPRLLRRASMGRSIESPGLSVAWAGMGGGGGGEGDGGAAVSREDSWIRRHGSSWGEEEEGLGTVPLPPLVASPKLIPRWVLFHYQSQR